MRLFIFYYKFIVYTGGGGGGERYEVSILKCMATKPNLLGLTSARNYFH